MRYRFFGYMAAYLSSIYGHRTGVLTKMRVKEVKNAIGSDETGYLINVSLSVKWKTFTKRLFPHLSQMGVFYDNEGEVH